jgi:hypothetical protein
VWAATARSWYKTEGGRITNNWSGTTARYWWMTRRFDAEHYIAQAREPAARAVPAAADADAPAATGDEARARQAGAAR